ncbi:MAG: 4-hydroxy-3-methylbut-2-enyl diphosphate reductase [Candidatus Woesearchaeota archaeon]
MIIVAKHAGFCSGVKRAVSTAFSVADHNKESRIFTYGELIHNPQVLKQLKDKKVKITKSLTGLKKGDILIIRSHGASPEVYRKAREKGLRVIDATCPFVKVAHEKIQMLEKEGFLPLIVGEAKHPEVMALRKFVRKAIVVADASKVPLSIKGKRIGVISQTTQPVENFNTVTEEARKLAKEIKVFNTICSATTIRQEEAKRLAGKVDIMIVVGGYSSANTKKLAELCSRIVETHQIETAEELKISWLKGKKRIGITAGASTPSEAIQDVESAIRSSA